MKNRKSQVRGMTSVLAMLYLVLFATLAVGFYSATNTQSQISSNDERVARASLAAESGLDFMRYQLGRVNIPPATATNLVVDELYADLAAQLNNTGNLGTATVVKNGNTISIPANGTIKLDSNADSRFRATITDWAGEIVVKVEGMYGATSVARAITMDFTRAQHPTSAFDYAVASKGQIKITKTPAKVVTTTGVDPSIATMMSAMAGPGVINVSAGTIGGDLSVTEDGTAAVTGGSVGGSSVPSVILSQHVHTVEKPEFPIVDTSIFKPYAVNTWTSGSTLKNIRIPANMDPKFTGGATIQGILYIESPNKVEFRGNVQLQGFIVFENKNDSSKNIIDMRGNFSHSPLPAGPEFDVLRSIGGIAVLAPTTKMITSGSVDSILKGNVILGSFQNGGSADWTIDRGTLMTLDEVADAVVFSGKTVKFSSTGGSNMPTQGLTYSSYYQPKPSSYQEVSP